MFLVLFVFRWNDNHVLNLKTVSQYLILLNGEANVPAFPEVWHA